MQRNTCKQLTQNERFGGFINFPAVRRADALCQHRIELSRELQFYLHRKIYHHSLSVEIRKLENEVGSTVEYRPRGTREVKGRGLGEILGTTQFQMSGVQLSPACTVTVTDNKSHLHPLCNDISFLGAGRISKYKVLRLHSVRICVLF